MGKMHEKGFTLVELAVAVGILTVVTAIILVNQNRFGGDISISDVAYQVAISVRQAQTYGLAALENGPGSGDFSGAYGVHFSSANTSQYILFNDKDRNGVYSGPGEAMLFFDTRKVGKISSLCVVGTPADACSPSISYLDIVFKRPEPDAYIRTNISPANYSSAIIKIESESGRTRSVHVNSVGQISVE